MSMYYRSLFPRDLYAELNRLQRDLGSVLDDSPTIRGTARGGYPAVNLGTTPDSVEVYAFAPGMDPAAIEVTLDRGVLSIEGERKNDVAGADGKATLHTHERFSGRFRRVLSLPDDIDPATVTADYRDGVLHVRIQRQASAQPRRIEVQ